MKKFWFLTVLLFCGVSVGQLSGMSAPPAPTPDPISTPGVAELPDCDDLEAQLIVFTLVHGIYTSRLETQQGELTEIQNNITQNNAAIMAAISSGASSNTLINLRDAGVALARQRAAKQAEIDETIARLRHIDMQIMWVMMQAMMGLCG